MESLKIAICDDDSAALSEEKELIDCAMRQTNTPYKTDTFLNSAQLINSNEVYDLIFLDIEMEGINGIITAEALHKKFPNCLIFFVTNYENYMDQALNVHAFRFWTKPINPDRLAYGIASALKELASRKKYLNVTVNRKQVSILMRDIIFAYTENRTTKIVTVNGIVETKDFFKNVKKQLVLDCFCEVHNSYCVNMNYIVNYTASSLTCRYKELSYDIFMSKRKSSEFRKKFTLWSGDKV